MARICRVMTFAVDHESNKTKSDSFAVSLMDRYDPAEP